MDLLKMEASVKQARDFLQALANQDRLMLLCALTQKEYCVSELEQNLGIKQPTLSQQLTVLRKEGIIQARKQGRHNYYYISDKRVLDVLSLLYQYFCSDTSICTTKE